MAQQVVGIRRPEAKTLAEQLAEIKLLQSTLKDLAGGDKQQSWLKDIASGVAESIAPILGQVLSRQQTMRIQPPDYQPSVQPQYQRLPPYQQPQPSVQAQAQPEAQPQGVQLEQLLEVLEMEPNEACDMLANIDRNWLVLLAGLNYDLIMPQITPLAEKNPELLPILEKLSSDTGRSWLNEVITAANRALNEQKP